MKLLESLKIRDITFKNRVMFPPLTTGYEEKDGSFGIQSRGFYKRLAEGGVGYIVIGDVTPIASFSPTPKLFNDSQEESLRLVVQDVHSFGTKLGIQLFYPEYDARRLFELFRQGKVDEMRAQLHYDMLHYVNEVSEQQLRVIIDTMIASILRAKNAGVDVIQIHGDRLVGSLCSTILNKRSDDYGGNFENRIRFALQLVQAIREAVPSILIDYKLPIITKDYEGKETGKGGILIEEAISFAKALEKAGVDMIHVGQANHTGNMNDTIPAMGTRPYGFMLEETKKIKSAVQIPVSMVGRICTPETGDALLESDICDLIAYGRPLLTDPDFVKKCEAGCQNQIRSCIMCNKGCTDAIQSRKFLSCVLNAENGYETKRKILPAKTQKKVAVVGAGVAGLEASRVLALKGHHVDLFESSHRLGGQINIACVPPRKEEMKRILHYYETMLSSLPIHLFLNMTFTIEDAKQYDTILVAVGAKCFIPNIPGILQKHVVSAWDVLDNKAVVCGKIAVCGGGLVGVETAETLALRGYDVSIIEMQDQIANEESHTILPILNKNLKDHAVKIYTNCRIKAIDKHFVYVELLDDKREVIDQKQIECDFVINALASVKNDFGLVEDQNKVIYIGDCAGEKPSTIEHAIKSAYDAANQI